MSKTILKCTDTKKHIEAKIISTNAGFALIIRDLEAQELIARVNSSALDVLLPRFNKIQEMALKESV